MMHVSIMHTILIKEYQQSLRKEYKKTIQMLCLCQKSGKAKINPEIGTITLDHKISFIVGIVNRTSNHLQ